ncbi:MAG: TolC family protein, partial [Gemmatimonadetes bacterium]|nr:TolC family protein [Gemmatimonadota bacterium]
NLRLTRAPARAHRPACGRGRTRATAEARRGHERRAVRVLAGALVLLALAVTSLVAQEVPARLTLDDAIRIAKTHNPGFLSTQNDAAPAEWGVREAYASFIPSATANSYANYTQGGTQRFGTVDLGATGTDWYQSGYSLGLNWSLSGQTIFGLPAARAQKRATRANIDAAAFDLESAVALQYMAVLRGQDGVDVARRQLDRANQNLAIVQARVESGAAAGTDGTQAEVEQGRAQVGLIQAQRALREARSMLGEQLGVTLDSEVELTSEFQVFQPQWDRERLIDMALSAHPRLHALEAQESAAKATARQAASRYFPTLNLSTGFSGRTQQATNRDYIRNQVISSAESQQSNCEFLNAVSNGLTQPLAGYPKDCAQLAATPADIQAALDQNAAFPFSFTKNPLSVTLSVSIPVFTGFQRQQQVSQAYEVADDAKQQVRAEELTLRTRVTQAFDNLTAAYQVVQLETRNRALAEEQLDMQRRRYTLGAAAMLELLDAQTTASTADQAYLNAVYDFHLNLIQLEAAVGQTLEHD